MADGELLVWIDMEMSGLDPRRERILEMATLVTDAELRVVAEGPELVIHQSESLLAGMDAWNTEHHGASGLTARVRESVVDEARAEAETFAFLQACGIAPRVAPLAGNTIHQDRLFLSTYMPTLEPHLPHRNLAVPPVKELARPRIPPRYAARPKKNNPHRALDDIKESIEELRFYRARAFK